MASMLHRYTNRRRSGAESSNVGGKTALSPGKDSTDYDLVVGGVANDKVFNTVELFFDGLIDKTEAINRLRYEKPNLQICFRTEKALSLLHFEGSETL